MPTILVNLPMDTRVRVYQNDLSALEELGDVLYFDPKVDAAETFAGLLAQADAVLTGWGSRRITADDLVGRAGKPLLIAHSAGSVRGVLAKELLSENVRLSQSASGVAVAVAQYTVGLMILALRQAVYRSGALRDGSKAGGVYQDLTGLTVGLVGLSQVGRRVPPLLAPFGLSRVLVYDPYASPEFAQSLGVTLAPDLEAMLAEVDVLSLHAPVTDETRNLISAERIALLKRGAVFINTARAPLVDQEALFARAIAGELEAYLDVTDPEPLPAGHAGWSSPHIFITPHIAGPTRQTLARIGQNALGEIDRFLKGEPLADEVTAGRYDLLA